MESARNHLILNLCKKLESQFFFLFGVDTTPALRPYAKKLEDRGIVHYPNPAPGNKPIGVGHSYSILAHRADKKGKSS